MIFNFWDFSAKAAIFVFNISNNYNNLYDKRGEQDKVVFWRQKIIEFYAKNKNQNNARTRFLAAESKFILTQPLFESFKKIKLRLPLGKSLKKKKAAMNKALKAYEELYQ